MIPTKNGSITEPWHAAGSDIHIHNAFLEAPETSGAELFEKLDLPWSAGYLDPENRTSTVRTFSVLQARSKVTKAYSGRGERYCEFIGEATDILDNLKSDKSRQIRSAVPKLKLALALARLCA